MPFSDIPNHRRESAQKATNRGFISAAKEYQAGEELTFDYGLLNDAVLGIFPLPSFLFLPPFLPPSLRLSLSLSSPSPPPLSPSAPSLTPLPLSRTHTSPASCMPTLFLAFPFAPRVFPRADDATPQSLARHLPPTPHSHTTHPRTVPLSLASILRPANPRLPWAQEVSGEPGGRSGHLCLVARMHRISAAEAQGQRLQRLNTPRETKRFAVSSVGSSRRSATGGKGGGGYGRLRAVTPLRLVCGELHAGVQERERRRRCA